MTSLAQESPAADAPPDSRDEATSSDSRSRVAEIAVSHFRNIASLRWKPAPGLNLIVGDNGQGKTNLLEAIHLSLLGRSFRTRREEDCIAWSGADDSELASVTTQIDRPSGPRVHRVALGRGLKRAFIDGVLAPRLASLFEGAAVVTFTPDDVDLFRGAPARRRRFLDQDLCQGSPVYLDSLQRYHKALKQINAVLKRARHGSASDALAQAEAFYPPLAEAGASLMLSRARYLADMHEQLGPTFENLGGTATLELCFDPSLKFEARGAMSAADLAASIAVRLDEQHTESARQGMLAFGPHRDDVRIRLGGRDLSRFGSQGQHRLVALAVKLVAAELLDRGRSTAPVLILDDFGSELDAERRRAVLSNLRGRVQTFVTGTCAEELGSADLFDEVRRIDSGRWAGDPGGR